MLILLDYWTQRAYSMYCQEGTTKETNKKVSKKVQKKFLTTE